MFMLVSTFEKYDVGVKLMLLEYLSIACIAFGLGIYLLYALLFPEKF